MTDAEKDEIDKKNKYLQAQKIRKEMKQIEEEITRSQETWKNLSEILQLQRDKKTGIDSQVQSYMQIQRDVDRCQEELSVQKRVGFGLSDSRSDATHSRQSLTEELTMDEEAIRSELALIQANSNKQAMDSRVIDRDLEQVRVLTEQKRQAEVTLHRLQR